MTKPPYMVMIGPSKQYLTLRNSVYLVCASQRAAPAMIWTGAGWDITTLASGRLMNLPGAQVLSDEEASLLLSVAS